MQRISAQKLTWTMAWRRKNKKGKTDNVTQKRRKKTVRVFKSIQGITIDDIRKRRTQTKEYRKAASENYKREIKDRVTKKSKGKATYAKKAVFAKTPKYRSTRVNMGKK